MSLLSKIRQHRTVKISGIKYKIRKINPILDFPQGKMPQIFSSFESRRKVDENQKVNDAVIRRSYEDMKGMIIAGLIKPKLGEEIKIDDIMCDAEIAFKLYAEILIHSLNRFSNSWRGVFFSRKLRRLLFTQWHKNLDETLSTFSSQMETTQ